MKYYFYKRLKERYFLKLSIKMSILLRIYLILGIMIILHTITSCTSHNGGEKSSKEQGILEFREYFSKNNYRDKYITRLALDADSGMELLDNDGFFIDLKPALQKMDIEGWGESTERKKGQELGELYSEHYARYWKIAEKYRSKFYIDFANDTNFLKLAKGIVSIGNREIARSEENSRFHSSCFAIPTAAINIYFTITSLMDAVEGKVVSDPLLVELNQVLKQVGMQAWTKPLRNDSTDDNIVSVERFQHHVWWVGGNALAYRSVLPCAVMMKSIPMLDVLSEVASQSISSTSQTTNETSFWTEGFTSDGAGWGHGMQCLIFGYPVDGTAASLNLLSDLKNSPWERKLSKENIESIFNYLSGSSFYHYKGYAQPFLSRHTFKYDQFPETIKSLLLATNLLNNWTESLNKEQIKELEQYKQEAEKHLIIMEDFPENTYSGTRYFYNNDDLVKKTLLYSIFINMASIRVDGTESFRDKADKLNLFTNDGSTLFTKEGREYLDIFGAWNVYAVPGVTNRHPQKQPKAITNWRGYCSKHNFAGAAVSKSGNAIAGFKFEKMNATAKKGVNDLTGLSDPNIELIYGVKAYKTYFMIGDYMLALGAGITNNQPEKGGDVKTTIDQTLLSGKISFLKDNVKNEIKEGNIKFRPTDNDGLTIIEQEGRLCYAILPEWSTREIELIAEKREAAWERHNKSNEDLKGLPETAKVFQLTYNHGKSPVSDTYAYMVYMGKESSDVVFASNPVKVLRNDTMIQAAQSIDKKVLGAVFYSTGNTLETNWIKLKVSHPTTLLLEKKENGYVLAVNDPMMDEGLKFLTISTNIPLKGAKKNGQWYSLRIKMPQGKNSGQPVSLIL